MRNSQSSPGGGPPLSDRSNKSRTPSPPLRAEVPQPAAATGRPLRRQRLSKRCLLYPDLDSSEATPSDHSSFHDARRCLSDDHCADTTTTDILPVGPSLPKRGNGNGSTTIHAVGPNGAQGIQNQHSTQENPMGIAVRFVNRPHGTPLAPIVEQKSYLTLRTNRSVSATNLGRLTHSSANTQDTRTSTNQNGSILLHKRSHSLDEVALRHLRTNGAARGSITTTATESCSDTEPINDIVIRAASPPEPPFVRADTPPGSPRWPGDLPTSTVRIHRPRQRSRRLISGVLRWLNPTRDESGTSQTQSESNIELHSRELRTGRAYWTPPRSAHGVERLERHPFYTLSEEESSDRGDGDRDQRDVNTAAESAPSSSAGPHAASHSAGGLPASDDSQRLAYPEKVHSRKSQGARAESPTRTNASQEDRREHHEVTLAQNRTRRAGNAYRTSPVPTTPLRTLSLARHLSTSSTETAEPTTLVVPTHAQGGTEHSMVSSDRSAVQPRQGDPEKQPRLSTPRAGTDRDDTTTRYTADGIPLYRADANSLLAVEDHHNTRLLTPSTQPSLAGTVADDNACPLGRRASLPRGIVTRNPSGCNNSGFKAHSFPRTSRGSAFTERTSTGTTSAVAVRVRRVQSAALPSLLPIAASEGIIRPVRFSPATGRPIAFIAGNSRSHSSGSHGGGGGGGGSGSVVNGGDDFRIIRPQLEDGDGAGHGRRGGLLRASSTSDALVRFIQEERSRARAGCENCSAGGRGRGRAQAAGQVQRRLASSGQPCWKCRVEDRGNETVRWVLRNCFCQPDSSWED
ncbi:hypothetical protein BDY21DRAFT_164004 [Lineolata rhizophorae]|uniref:Uncharacterized protein n=1 Tax=Lineolata rhizophorae TaxID=578093 RepID=A0A6A6P9E0_9PEZI|nr:hypothetical protein BDY21DRAFT_164004 [Lineolata rhizophorae]